jgi:hypothetical protein
VLHGESATCQASRQSIHGPCCELIQWTNLSLTRALNNGTCPVEYKKDGALFSSDALFRCANLCCKSITSSHIFLLTCTSMRIFAQLYISIHYSHPCKFVHLSKSRMNYEVCYIDFFLIIKIMKIKYDLIKKLKKTEFSRRINLCNQSLLHVYCGTTFSNHVLFKFIIFFLTN